MYTGLPQAFQANVPAKVRVKVKARDRPKRKGKAEKEQMLVGAAKETHNSNSRSKAGFNTHYITTGYLINLIPCRQRQRHTNNSGNNMTLSDQIMQGALNARKNNPPSSSASSDGNDEAAMAVIMSLLEVSIYN